MDPGRVSTGAARARQASFTTAGLAPKLRASQWDEYCRRWFAEFRCRTLLASSFRMNARTTSFDQLDLTEMFGDGSLVERTPSLIRSAPCDRVTLGIVLRGRAFFHHQGGSDILEQGDAILYDPDSPAVYGLSDGFRELDIYVSRELYDDRYGTAWVDRPRIIRCTGDGPVAAHIDAVVRIARTPLVDDVDPVAATAATLDLFDLVIGGKANAGAGYWLSARAHIHRHLHDPNLSVGEVSCAVGVSERHLARVFAERSTSVARVIADERMRRARDLLADPDRQTLPISEVALRCGFTSPSQFARAFRRRYGCSARELRAAARADSELVA